VPAADRTPSNLPDRPDLAFEKERWQRGLPLVAGIDEAGRGALAGPVFAAVVVLPANETVAQTLHGVTDSKLLRPKKRNYWAEIIQQVALSFSLGSVSSREIDEIGILPATRLAVRRALLDLPQLPDHLLVDYIRLPRIPIPQTSLVKGDARSLSIAAASILAKTARDKVMLEMDEKHPGYDWRHNKGYGTQAHLKAIEGLGPCAQHRRSFAPLRKAPVQLAMPTNQSSQAADGLQES
jgi:ribonuclease HII